MATQIEGMEELQRSIRRLGNIQQRDVTKVAKKGANIPLKDARANAPVRTGQLKKGIVIKGERSRNRAKKVYQVTFNPSMNDIFQKPYGTGNKYAYYPASQEYGFILRNGGKKAGLNFMKNSIESNAGQIENVIVQEMSSLVDGALRRR